ncbi:hypothetical protein CRUP_000613 [Coryphaenoides rupestris]|nr:hypothetical protein CRUP_000613 [Coryphaenoides rupestris]
MAGWSPGTPAATEVVTGAGTGAPLGVTIITDVGSLNLGDQVRTTAPSGVAPSDAPDVPATAPAELETKAPLKMVLPVVSCVEEKDIDDSHIRVVVKTSGCEETKDLLESLPAAWCAEEVCRLLVSQDGNKMLVSSHDATSNVAAALQNKDIIEKLGVSDVQSSSPSSGTSVFVGTQEPAETTELPEPDKEPAEITADVPEKPGANGEAPEEPGDWRVRARRRPPGPTADPQGPPQTPRARRRPPGPTADPQGPPQTPRACHRLGEAAILLCHCCRSESESESESVTDGQHGGGGTFWKLLVVETKLDNQEECLAEEHRAVSWERHTTTTTTTRTRAAGRTYR